MFGGIIKDSFVLGTAFHLGKKAKRTNYKAKRGPRGGQGSIFEPKEEIEIEIWPPLD
jgi:hypothetical protein